ncbi:MAG: hypothetical protein GTO24_27955, partial [candidate division Zixibacteria bacterium]|nr:hypothetical protein [candidate division Zixibacteria bacterium]
MPNLAVWYQNGVMPRSFLARMGKGGWFGFKMNDSRLEKLPALREAIVFERLAKISPGVAVAVLAHNDLGLVGLWLFGSEKVKQKYAAPAARGKTLLCLGNTESGAGSDVAGISMAAKQVKGGWVLNGTKAYITNGSISDMAVI